MKLVMKNYHMIKDWMLTIDTVNGKYHISIEDLVENFKLSKIQQEIDKDYE